MSRERFTHFVDMSRERITRFLDMSREIIRSRFVRKTSGKFYIFGPLPPCSNQLLTGKPLHVLFQVYPNGCSQVSKSKIERVQIQNYTNTGYGIPKLFAEYIQYNVWIKLTIKVVYQLSQVLWYILVPSCPQFCECAIFCIICIRCILCINCIFAYFAWECYIWDPMRCYRI